MPRSEGGSTTDQPVTAEQTETERVMEQRRGERGGQDATGMTGMRTYTVKAGDSLSAIAESEMGDAKRWPELYAANKDAVGKNPDLIHPGLELKIPV
ncbi:MAG TPA: LysM peptidoglycan-binding domain-containing protein [Candidatus Limnocylindria bacterium]|nr:LysM peptidoglycan-binding domain-containing protein [Candidatus Limnocylindria bacterium]